MRTILPFRSTVNDFRLVQMRFDFKDLPWPNKKMILVASPQKQFAFFHEMLGRGPKLY